VLIYFIPVSSLGLIKLKLILPEIKAGFKNLNYQKFLLDSSDVIDKWISQESLERVTESIKFSSKKKGKGK